MKPRNHQPGNDGTGPAETKRFTPRDLRNAVILAVLVTTAVVLALLDPSCRHSDPAKETGPSRSIIQQPPSDQR